MITAEHDIAAAGHTALAEQINQQLLLPAVEELILIGMATERAMPKINGFRYSSLRLSYQPADEERALYFNGEGRDIFQMGEGQAYLSIDYPSQGHEYGRRKLDLSLRMSPEGEFYTITHSSFDITKIRDDGLFLEGDKNIRNSTPHTLDLTHEGSFFPDLEEGFRYAFSDDEYKKFEQAYNELKGSEELQSLIKQVVAFDLDRIDISDVMNGEEEGLIRMRAEYHG